MLRLAVKFFPPDPGQLQEEYTRFVLKVLICITYWNNRKVRIGGHGFCFQTKPALKMSKKALLICVTVLEDTRWQVNVIGKVFFGAENSAA